MSNALRRVVASGFRSLQKVDVRFGPFSVLVGPNGSGKSNLLKVLSFIRDSARFDPSQAISLLGGFSHVLRQDGRQGTVSLSIEAVVSEFASSNALDKYTLNLTESADGDIERDEELLYKSVRGRGRRQIIRAQGLDVSIDDLQQKAGTRQQFLRLASDSVSALGTIARLDEGGLGSGPRDFFEFLSTVRYLDPDVNAARTPSRMNRAELHDDASNLASALYALSEASPDAFDALQRDLARCLPGMESLGFGVIGGAAASIVVQLQERGVIQPIELADASFGTVRLLALLTALHDPAPPQLTIIEEIDHGLHPYALDVLVERMREASSRTQIIVASHSPTLVNRLRPEEIIICDRDPDTGASIIPVVDSADVADAVADSEWRLGELWFSGALGGVPA
ncbi:AAA family ATPase [Microbacterium sp. NPDC058342]|uniref:AAA family ATPase n=1 Tax=Microbacterium sp. NPDC058342 TaxID=3346454 RepID=UPI0036526C8D